MAPQGGGIGTVAEGPITSLTLKNSIVAGNSGADRPDISGTFITGGYNLIQHSAGGTVNDPMQKHQTDIAGERLPTLGIVLQLNTNGGPTPTMALQAGSPAVNRIPAASCDSATDQRGVKRPQQGACDIGAYEYNN